MLLRILVVMLLVVTLLVRCNEYFIQHRVKTSLFLTASADG